MILLIDVIILLSSSIVLYSVDTWSILECSSLCPPWFLATSNFVWSILASLFVLDVQHLIHHDVLIKSVPKVSYCYEYIFVHQYRQFYWFPKLVCILSVTLVSPLSLWFCSFVFHSLGLSSSVYCFTSTLLFQPWFFFSIIPPWSTVYLCYPLLYPLGLFLTRYLPLCLSFPVCVIMWNHNLAIWDTI